MRKALITGITGQDGSYLTELLLQKGYHVHGLVRRASSFNTGRIDHLYKDPHERPALELHHGDVNDASSLRALLERIQPDEVYNLAAQSHVRVSFDLPVVTAESVALGTLKLLEAVRDVAPKHIRVYQAGSSEMFGGSPPPQSESTPFRPRSPYACGKVFAHHAVVNYREAFGMFAVNGILFNHESPRRGETFVTRKVTRAVGRIKLGLQERLYLGTLEPTRDWGYAGDYVEAMWRMLQQADPDDYVVATGESHSVGEWVEAAFAEAGLPWKSHVAFDERYLRPTEVDALRGDPSKAHAILGWKPKVGFRELVRKMVLSDVKLAERERLLTNAGHDASPSAEAGR